MNIAISPKAHHVVPDNVPLDRVHDIDIFNFVGPDEDFHQAIKRFQGAGIPGLIWTPRNGGHWLATRGRTIREILNDPGRFSSRVIVLPKAAGENYDLIPTGMDPPDHGVVRQIVDKILNLREIRRLEGTIRAIAVELIEPFAADGQVDFSTAFAQPFPIRVFMAMLDLPMKDAPLLKHCASQILRPDGATPDEMAASVERAISGFYAYLETVLDERWGKEGADGIAVVLNSEVNGHPMERKMALSIIANLLLAGLDTVVGFLGFMVLFLARNPAYTKQLTDNPGAIPQCIEELFRRFPIVGDARIVPNDLEFDGVQLKAGDMIQIPTALSGLDDEMNEDPWTVDFKRRRPLHNTFGSGPHRCAGLHLARTEIMVTLQEWLTRIPEFRIVEGTKPRYLTGMVATVENIQLEWTPKAV
jgi:cytochrome P450